jgi:hypothetical protein
MQANIYHVLDIKEMCVTACVNNKKIVNRIFQECGEKASAIVSASTISCIELFLIHFFTNNHYFSVEYFYIRNLYLFVDRAFILVFSLAVSRQHCGCFMTVIGFSQFAALLLDGLLIILLSK